MYYTNGPWSHTGLFAENGYVIESITHGVVKRPFSDYLDEKSYIAIMSPTETYVTWEQWQKIIAHAESYLGMPYGWIMGAIMGLNIITGRASSFRWKFVFDHLLLLSFCSLLGLWWPPAGYFFGTLGALYLLIVLINVKLKRSKKKINLLRYISVLPEKDKLLGHCPAIPQFSDSTKPQGKQSFARPANQVEDGRNPND